jgi:hypothetical protein
MSEPTIKPRFQAEIARVHRNERVLQQVYEARLHAGDANRAVDTAKVALADAVIAAGGTYTYDDLVAACVEGLLMRGEPEKKATQRANVIVERLTGVKR